MPDSSRSERPQGAWRAVQWVNIALVAATLVCALSIAALVVVEHPTTKEIPYMKVVGGKNVSLATGPDITFKGKSDPCKGPAGIYLMGLATGQPAVNCTSGMMTVWEKPPSETLLFLNSIMIPLGLLMTGFATASLFAKWVVEKRKEKEITPGAEPAHS